MGPAGVELLGGDADLRPQAELAAVGKAGGGVDVDRRGVHLVEEALGLRNSSAVTMALAVAGGVTRAMCASASSNAGHHL